MAARTKGRIRYTVDELCAVYLNEDAHTEHVARLALHLFDGVRRWTGLTRYDRPLLEAAARLHDVGYAMDPRDHMRKSVDIVRSEGLAGFSEQRLRYILAAMALHQNTGRTAYQSALLDALPQPKRGLRIGALLRIADGLDQSHIQDATITGMRKAGETIWITVRSPLSPENLVRADDKASLWREVFPLGVRFEQDTAAQGDVRLLRGGLHRLEAFRRLAYRQFKVVRYNEGGAKAGADPEHLHDLRVALRRLRSLLKLYRKPLRDTWAADIERRLGAIGDALGPARDFDVWLARVRAMAAERDMSRSRVWRRYLTYQESLVDTYGAQVRQVLDGARYGNVTREIAYLLRAQVPERVKTGPHKPVEPYVARRLWRLSKRIAESPIPGGAWEVEDFHAFRKECRRGRYMAEHFGAVLGAPVRRWGKTLKRMADALGDLHDADVELERMAYEAVAPPRELVTSLKAQRNKALNDVDAAWAELKDKEQFRKLKRALKEHGA